MRTETKTIKIYKLNELSPKGQERAREIFTSTDEFHAGDEYMDSLKALAVHFGGKLSNWRIDFYACSYSYARFEMPEDMDEVEIAARLAKLGTFNPDTLHGNGDCELTGVCYDEDAIDGFRIAFMRDKERDLGKLMQAAFETWLKSAQGECEYQSSMEAFKETCEANEYEFTEDGNLHR